MRAGGVVAADIDEGAGAGLVQSVDDLGAILVVGLVAGRSEPGVRRVAETAEIGLGERGEVDVIALAHAAHPMPRAEHLGGRETLADLERRSADRLVDDRGRPAALGNHENVAHACLAPRIGERELGLDYAALAAKKSQTKSRSIATASHSSASGPS